MAIASQLYSHKSDEWETPQNLFDAYNAVFGFTLDAAATVENAKCNRYYSIEDDSLTRSWKGETVWLNPPYSRMLDFARKAAKEAMGGGESRYALSCANRYEVVP